jgi:hypothetical protein
MCIVAIIGILLTYLCICVLPFLDICNVKASLRVAFNLLRILRYICNLILRFCAVGENIGCTVLCGCAVRKYCCEVMFTHAADFSVHGLNTVISLHVVSTWFLACLCGDLSCGSNEFHFKVHICKLVSRHLKSLHPDDNITIYFKVPKFQYVTYSRRHLISIHCTISDGYSETRLFWDVMYM